MAVLKVIDPFVERLFSASAARISGVKVLLHNRERVLVEVAGKPYLIVFINAETELTPGKVMRRVADWKRIKNRNIQGHIVVSRESELSPTLISLDGANLPSRVAVVGDWSGKNQLVTSQIDSNMARLLEIIGISKGEIARSRKPKRSGKKSTKRSVVSSAATAVAQVSLPPPTFERNLRKRMRIDGYELEKRLGSGASAEVWSAKVIAPPVGTQLTASQRVAIKFYTIPPNGAQTIRIQREFDLAANTGHNHLARVYDLMISPSRPFHTFMVMEYVDGPTLKSLINSVGKLTPLQTVILGTQLFEGLAELHSLGALHRDVKAANIMMSKYSGKELEIKLVDLGIVSVSSESRLTAHSVFLGSKHSAPLEQLTGKELDERTDIYGAGSVLYHCLTGRPMYDGAGPEAAIVMEMLQSPANLSKLTTDSDEQLISFINSCISVSKDERPATVDDCLSTLRTIFERLGDSHSPTPSKRNSKTGGGNNSLFSVEFDQDVTESLLARVKMAVDDWLHENRLTLIGFGRNPRTGGVVDIEIRPERPVSVDWTSIFEKLHAKLIRYRARPLKYIHRS